MYAYLEKKSQSSNRYTFFATAIIASTIFILSSCQKKTQTDNPLPLKLVASNSIIADIVHQVAGNNFSQTTLMEAGADPHTWQPTPHKIADVSEAMFIFINGIGLEDQILPVLKNLDGPVLIDLSQDIENLIDTNPHVWFSPQNVVLWVEKIAQVLSQADPENANTYIENARRYNKMLEALHREIQEQIAQIPVGNRNIITDHDMLPYFALEYGLTIRQMIFPNMGHQASPSAKHMEEVLELIQGDKVQAIVVGMESANSIPELTDTIPITFIFTDSLAKNGEMGSNYLDYMRYNTRQIVNALGERD